MTFNKIWESFRKTKPEPVDLATMYEGRPFFAIQLVPSQKTINKIMPLLKKLKQNSGISIDDTASFHCSLKFIGWSEHPYLAKCASDAIVTRAQTFIAQIQNQPLKAQIGPINRFPNVIFLEVHNQQINELHEQLRKVVPTRFEHEGEDFLPHCTIARFVSETAATDDLEQLREEPPINGVFDTIQLVKTEFINGIKRKTVLQRKTLAL